MKLRESKTVMKKDHWMIKLTVFNPVIPFVEYRLWHQCLSTEGERAWWTPSYIGLCNGCGAAAPEDIMEIKKDLEYLQSMANHVLVKDDIV